MQTVLEKTTTTPVASRLLELFYSRTDVVPYQWWSEPRQIGGYAKACQQQPPWSNVRCPHKKQSRRCRDCEDFAAIPVDEKVIDLHLKGACTLGTYQLATDSTSVKWLCLDIDDHGESTEQELQDAAMIAGESLRSLGFAVSIEASGGQGWRCHVWVFFDALVPAIKARLILEAALRQANLHEKPFERFPKQSRALNGYGNLVKLPLGVHRKTGKRSVFLDPVDFDKALSTEEALGAVQTVDPAAVDFAIDMLGLKVEDLPKSEARTVTKFDYPATEMRKLISHCWWLQEVERKQLSDDYAVHYEDWWSYVLMLARFGEPGTNRIIQFSQLDERFDENYTISTVNYIREHGYHMPSCRRLRGGPGMIHCPNDPMECGAAGG